MRVFCHLSEKGFRYKHSSRFLEGRVVPQRAFAFLGRQRDEE